MGTPGGTSGPPRPRRRELLVGVGGLVAGAAVGALSAAGAAHAWDQELPEHLPFYGGFASAVRPDRGRPSASDVRVFWRSPDSTARRVALTFDDGPAPKWTPQVLATLADYDIPATFFLQGVNIADHGSLHRGSVGRHELGVHGFTHPDMARLGYAACRDQLRRDADLIRTTYGVVPTLFRPPYGHLAGAAILAAAESGLTTVLWSAQMHEGSFTAHPAGIVADIAAQAHPGAIILAHDVGAKDRLIALDHLGAIIERLRDDGYAFGTVSDLVAAQGAGARVPGP